MNVNLVNRSTSWFRWRIFTNEHIENCIVNGHLVNSVLNGNQVDWFYSRSRTMITVLCSSPIFYLDPFLRTKHYVEDMSCNDSDVRKVVYLSYTWVWLNSSSTQTFISVGVGCSFSLQGRSSDKWWSRLAGYLFEFVLFLGVPNDGNGHQSAHEVFRPLLLSDNFGVFAATYELPVNR